LTPTLAFWTAHFYHEKKVWKREIQCHINNISKDQFSTELYLINMFVLKYKMLVLIKQIQNNAIYTSGQMLLQYTLWTTVFLNYICQDFVNAKNGLHLL
jgi:hypothetical protein